jgi:hypothetical protein
MLRDRLLAGLQAIPEIRVNGCMNAACRTT